MKYKAKKLLAYLMTMIMVLQMVPMSSAVAAGSGFVTFEISGPDGYTPEANRYYIAVQQADNSYIAEKYETIASDGVISTALENPIVILKDCQGVEHPESPEGKVLAIYPSGSLSEFVTPTNIIDEYPVYISKEDNSDYKVIIGETYNTQIRSYSRTSEVKTISVGSGRQNRIDTTHPNTQLEPPELSDYYYVLAEMTDGERKVGWAIKPVTLNGNSVVDVPFDQFREYGPAGKTVYYQKKYTVKTRIYHINYDMTWTLKDKDNPDDLKRDAKDTPENGYEYISNYEINGQNIIEIKKSYPDKLYGIKVTMNQPGLEISADIHDYVVVQFGKGDGRKYVVLPLTLSGADKTFTAEDFLSGTAEDAPDEEVIWLDQNGHFKKDKKFTGNETSIKVYILQPKNPSNPDTYKISEIVKEGHDNLKEIVPGSSINGYSFTIDQTLEEEIDHQNGVQYFYNTIHFVKDTGGVTKGYIDSYLQTATDFGLYTEELAGHISDMEANIAAASVTGPITAEYGFSGRNTYVNSISVVKKYVKEGGKPYKDKTVHLELFVLTKDKDGNEVEQPVEFQYTDPSTEQTVTITAVAEGKTNAEGVFSFKFEGLPAGRYVLKEKIGNTYYDYKNGTVKVQDGNEEVTVKFTDGIITIRNINENINYFDSVNSDVAAGLLSKSRNGYVYAGNTNTYDLLNGVNQTLNPGERSIVMKAGAENGYGPINIISDMSNLRDLSEYLADEGKRPSETVNIMTVYASEITNSGIIINDASNRFTVVNVIMDNGDSFNPEISYNGTTLEGDFGRGGRENSSKVLYNILNTNRGLYTGEVKTTKQGVGVMLAPSAHVTNLGGVWGGTIICQKCTHSGNEIHSDNANKIINENTMLSNSVGEQNTGDLEIRKTVTGTKQRNVDFTFEIQLTKANGEPIGDRPDDSRFVVSGIKGKDTIKFEQGKATIKLRADGHVIISGIPVGYRYTVHEIENTIGTEYYKLADGEVNERTGSIVADQVRTETYINEYHTDDTSITLDGEKSYEGGTLTKGKFTFTVKNEANQQVATGSVETDGSITFTPIVYRQADMGGETEKTFTYTIKEDIPEEANENNQYTYNGIKYDNSTKTVQVKVTDQDGKLRSEEVV